ncbi:hypothetical protein EDC04DRAFT_2147242 [Pisolithus marmoratus]|nr:hypothetical protein EDC04DRAFT_2147242 [Pisolithus marmoratus]
MSIREPAWRKRSRPCPFYSQGRCLFADSCNFLHNIKVRAPVVDLTVSHTTSQCNARPNSSSDPPAIVVNTTGSYPSEGLPSPVPQSSRYSSLLSVLEDVIGPDQNTSSQDGMDARVSGCPDGLSSHSVMASSNITMVTESDLTLVGHCDSEDSISSLASDPALPSDDIEMVVPSSQSSVYINPSPICETLTVGESRTLPTAINGEEVVECPAYEVDADQLYEDSGVSRVVEAEVATVEYDVKEFEHAPTRPFGRESVTSVASLFSGVSLLASPQDTRGKIFTSSPSDTQPQARTPDLLSPVQLSAKLRPFSLSSVRGPPQRGDSIDSGYAEGDSWIDPEPLSRSPPPKAPYLVSSSRHSHGLPSTSPLMQEYRLAYCVSSGRSSPFAGSVEASILEGTEDVDDGTSSIIDIYESSSSDAEGGSSPTMKISDVTILHAAHENGTNTPPNTGSSTATVTSTSGTFESGGLRVEPFLQPTDNENVSSGPALSAQSSLDFSDASSSRVSLLRHDSPLSSRPGSSTPNTSLFSEDSDSSCAEESLYLPNSGNADNATHSEEFQHVTDENTLRGPILAPLQSMASPEEKSNSSRLGKTGDYETSDNDISTDASFLLCLPTPTRRKDVEVVEDLETGRSTIPSETIPSFGLIPVEGVLQFPMPPTPEGAAPSTSLGDAVTSQQLTFHNVADMRFLPSSAKSCSAQLICAPSDFAVDTCLSKRIPSTSGNSSTSEDFDSSRPAAGPSDTNRLFAHSPVFERPSLSAADRVGEAPARQCSNPSSLYLLGHQHVGDDLREHRASTSCTNSPALIPRYVDISSNQGSQHIALRSPWTSPCSSSPPAAILPPVSQSVPPRSGSVFRPLLTGRKSLLEESLFGDRISQNAFVARDRSITVSGSSRPRAKEVGSTSISLNSVRCQFSASPSIPISDDECSSGPPVNMAAVQESLSAHPRSHSAPPCRGLRPLKLVSAFS